MSTWPADTDTALDAFYTRPDGSARWEVQNLVYISAPWKCYLAGTKTELARGIRIHRKVATDLTAIFGELWALYGKSQDKIAKAGLDQIGGAYYFRARRGSRRLSNHARGIAIDIDPLHNAMRRGNRGNMEAATILGFQKHGWRWGGEFSDPMHFEAVHSSISEQIAKAWKGNPVIPAPVQVANKPAAAEKWTIPIAALNLIRRWESFVDHAYDDRGSLAIGYGHTAKIGLPVVTHDMKVTEAEAAAILMHDVEVLAGTLMPLVKVKLNPNQLGAILVFAYNIGRTNFAGSTFLKKVNAGDFAEAAGEFGKWIKSTNPKTGVKEVLPGLIKRRASERELFVS